MARVLIYDKQTGEVSLRYPLFKIKKIYVLATLRFPLELANIFNLTKNSWTSGLIAEHPYKATKYYKNFIKDAILNCNRGINELFVTSNLVKHSLFGDSYKQILRVIDIPSEALFGTQLKYKYKRPHYHPLNTKQINNININITDINNCTIPFQFGHVIITLHFRKIKNG